MNLRKYTMSLLSTEIEGFFCVRVGSITNANGQIKQKLEEIGGTLFFKISRHIHPGGLCTFHDDVAISERLRQTCFRQYSVAPVPAPS
jgi:hypothetical protein